MKTDRTREFVRELADPSHAPKAAKTTNTPRPTIAPKRCLSGRIHIRYNRTVVSTQTQPDSGDGGLITDPIPTGHPLPSPIRAPPPMPIKNITMDLDDDPSVEYVWRLPTMEVVAVTAENSDILGAEDTAELAAMRYS